MDNARNLILLEEEVKILDKRELREIIDQPYSDANFSKLAYHMVNKLLEPYVDEELMESLFHKEQEIYPKGLDIKQRGYRAYCTKFSFGISALTGAMKEFRYYSNHNLLEGVGIFSVETLMKFSKEYKKNIVSNILENAKLEGGFVPERYLIAFYQADTKEWEIMIVSTRYSFRARKKSWLQHSNFYGVRTAIISPEALFDKNIYHRDISEHIKEKDSYSYYVTQERSFAKYY